MAEIPGPQMPLFELNLEPPKNLVEVHDPAAKPRETAKGLQPLTLQNTKSAWEALFPPQPTGPESATYDYVKGVVGSIGRDLQSPKNFMEGAQEIANDPERTREAAGSRGKIAATAAKEAAAKVGLVELNAAWKTLKDSLGNATPEAIAKLNKLYPQIFKLEAYYIEQIEPILASLRANEYLANPKVQDAIEKFAIAAKGYRARVEAMAAQAENAELAAAEAKRALAEKTGLIEFNAAWKALKDKLSITHPDAIKALNDLYPQIFRLRDGFAQQAEPILNALRNDGLKPDVKQLVEDYAAAAKNYGGNLAKKNGG